MQARNSIIGYPNKVVRGVTVVIAVRPRASTSTVVPRTYLVQRVLSRLYLASRGEERGRDEMETQSVCCRSEYQRNGDNCGCNENAANDTMSSF